jgi:hypothetical protein
MVTSVAVLFLGFGGALLSQYDIKFWKKIERIYRSTIELLPPLIYNKDLPHHKNFDTN